jgi:hypothetical protein
MSFFGLPIKSYVPLKVHLKFEVALEAAGIYKIYTLKEPDSRLVSRFTASYRSLGVQNTKNKIKIKLSFIDKTRFLDSGLETRETNHH